MTSGTYGPNGTHEGWYPIYDKTRAAGKSLWVKVYSGKLAKVQRYGSHGLFLYLPEMLQEQGKHLPTYAEKHWNNEEGTF